jgi:hypothetical protein
VIAILLITGSVMAGVTLITLASSSDASQTDMAALESLILAYLEANQFRGVISGEVIDPQTGDELNLDIDLRHGTPEYPSCDIAYAGLSTMKVAILVEYYRYLGWEPGAHEQDVIDKTIIDSSTLLANVMLADIGYGDPYLGAQRVTESMNYLELENTFIVAPYDDDCLPSHTARTRAAGAVSIPTRSLRRRRRVIRPCCLI